MGIDRWLAFTVSLEGNCDICHKPLVNGANFTIVDKVEMENPHSMKFHNESYHDHCKDPRIGP